MTSANVIEYRIRNLKGIEVGKHRQHCLCKSHWEALLKFQPLENYTIQPWGYNEDEEYWEDAEINLKDFINKLKIKL